MTCTTEPSDLMHGLPWCGPQCLAVAPDTSHHLLLDHVTLSLRYESAFRTHGVVLAASGCSWNVFVDVGLVLLAAVLQFAVSHGLAHCDCHRTAERTQPKHASRSEDEP